MQIVRASGDVVKLFKKLEKRDEWDRRMMGEGNRGILESWERRGQDKKEKDNGLAF